MQTPSPTSRAEPLEYPAKSGSGRKKALIGAGVLAAGLLATVFLMMGPKAGTLVVTASGPGNKALDSVQIMVDGEKKCSTSPCRIAELPVGTHMVKVTAPGYPPTADTAVKVRAGEEEVMNITLTGSAQGTGIRVSAEGTGLKLLVDGQDVGPLPAEVKDLTPGEHTIKVAGSDRYEAFEQKINVEADKMQSIGPIKLKVIKGMASIQPGENADGAKVVLVSGSERRPIPSLPIKIDITTDKSYTLEATRKGYVTYSQPITFDDGQAEKTFTIDLRSESEEKEKQKEEAVASAPDPTPPKSGGTGSKPAAFLAGQAGGSEPKPAEKPEKPAATGMGKLNANSIPVSKVIVDGQPQGQTPRIGINLSAGSHTVVFVHPEKGRKVQTVNIKPGQTATAVVKF